MFKWETKKGTIIRMTRIGITNCYLIETNSTNILVDTGQSRHFKKLKSFLHANLTSLNKTLDYLILTHTHYDHAGNASKVKDFFDPQVIVHEKESKFLSDGFTTLPKGTNFITNLLTIIVNKYFSSIGKYEALKSDIDFKLLEQINLDNLEIIETPGHTSGSLSVLVDHEMAIVGDTLFGVQHRNIFPPFADDKKVLMETWKKLLETKCILFFPAHGKVIKRDLLQREYYKKV
jgi:glyoxylase-like metal-dependent hydrolase (beta-lactamase superfamily II)